MPGLFENLDKAIGLKQSRRALREGRVREAYVAGDAEERITGPFAQACRSENIPVTEIPTMRELGAAAGIEIGAAVVTVLK